MCADDPHRFSNHLDEPTTRHLIDRLESRAKDAVFNRLFDQYITRLQLSQSVRVLEIGCGTGAMSRALVRRARFSGNVIGVDQSPAFIDAAERFAIKEGVGKLVEFKIGDAHDLDIEDDSFDVIIAHTVISHVTDPLKVLKEVARLVRKGGRVAIFDGDYGSLTYAFSDPEFGQQMDHALVSVTFNNPLIVRDLVCLLPATGLEVTETLADVVSEIGTASYFKSFAETYAPMVARAGLLPKEDVDNWLASQNAAMNDRAFFASCNYYAYLARRS